jgi:hypothetical protein
MGFLNCRLWISDFRFSFAAGEKLATRSFLKKSTLHNIRRQFIEK